MYAILNQLGPRRDVGIRMSIRGKRLLLIGTFCSFIVSFLNNAPDAEKDSAAVQEFLGNMETAFRAHSLWAGCSEEELESAGEVSTLYMLNKALT